jgi:hypothetical protein
MAEDIVSKNKRATVRFCDGVSVDGYEMPDGSFRVGITTASLVAGYAENYLGRQLSGSRSKALQGIGFSGEIVPMVRATKTGDREERTISTKDFLRFLRHADRSGKPVAMKRVSVSFSSPTRKAERNSTKNAQPRPIFRWKIKRKR